MASLRDRSCEVGGPKIAFSFCHRGFKFVCIKYFANEILKIENYEYYVLWIPNLRFWCAL